MTNVSCNVPIIDDSIFEGDEDFMLSVNRSSLPSDADVGESATVTIVDNDCK